jgi:hypothetical protein
MGGKPCLLRVLSISTASRVAKGSPVSGGDTSVLCVSAAGPEGSASAEAVPISGDAKKVDTVVLAVVAVLAQPAWTRTIALANTTAACFEKATNMGEPHHCSKKAAGQLPSGLRA